MTGRPEPRPFDELLLSQFIVRAHALWCEIECTDDPAVRRECFAEIAEIEKLICRQVEAMRKPVPQWEE
jgi:hypothetical protein